MNADYNSKLLLNIAIAQVKLDNKPSAMIALNKAIKYKPDYSKALVKRGEILITMEEYDEAIKDFSTASEYD